MKNIRLLTFVLIIGMLVLSACGAAAATPTAAPQGDRSAKVDAMPVSFVGIVDSMAGDQWVISGTTVTVDASIVRDGPFNVGDQVKVEGFVNPDGSFTLSRVESPTPQEAATLPPVSVDNSNEAPINANINDSSSGVNSNDDNSNASNSNDSNANDDNGGNSNDDNSNNSNTNDDNGGNSNDDSSNDDNGGNSNDDDSNDDHGGNSNDDNGDDDNSGKGGGDDKGDDDNGGNTNDD
jgi:hypothetical protein